VNLLLRQRGGRSVAGMTRRFSVAVSGAVLALTSLFAAPASYAAAPTYGRVGCTLTSTHHCIRAGQYCPYSKRNKFGYDAHGARLRCYGNPPRWHHV